LRFYDAVIGKKKKDPSKEEGNVKKKVSFSLNKLLVNSLTIFELVFPYKTR